MMKGTVSVIVVSEKLGEGTPSRTHKRTAVDKVATHLKCRLCDYRVRKIYTRKDGKVSGIGNAFERLSHHFETKHPKEYNEMIGKERKFYRIKEGRRGEVP